MELSQCRDTQGHSVPDSDYRYMKQSKSDILKNLVAQYGSIVTRANLQEFERAGGGNCAWIGKLPAEGGYRSGRGVYTLPSDGIITSSAPASAPVVRLKKTAAPAVFLPAPVASANSVIDESSSLSFAVKASSSASETLARIEALVSESSALARIPEKNSAFVPFGEFDVIRQIIKSKQFHPVFITGLSGNGKTFQIEQACALEKVEHIRINDLASPKVMCLQPVLEGKPLTIKKLGVVIAPKPGFTVFATANTKGRGSDDGRFAGTNLLNEAFLERFPITVEQAYPSIQVEKKILLKSFEQLGRTATAENITFFETLARWAETIRVTYFEEGIEDLISTRRLVHIVKTFAIFPNESQALALCLNRFDTSVQAKFLDLYKKFAPDVEPVIEPTLRVDADGHLVAPTPSVSF